MKSHRFASEENWRKIKENEQNRGLNERKGYEDQLTFFCQSSLGSVLYSLILSYSCTLREILGHSQSILGVLYHSLGFGEIRKMNAGKRDGTSGSTTIVGLICK